MRHSNVLILFMGLVVGLQALLVGCEETRFTGVKTQVDTYEQKGDAVVEEFSQDGMMQIDRFDQSGFSQVDSFTQNAAAMIDILWAVDNSASMLEEQAKLAANFNSFIKFIDESFIDYHIGVISTDMVNQGAGFQGKLRGETPEARIISRETQPSPQEVFTTNINVGGTGFGNEEGFFAAHEALSSPELAEYNAGFVREEASLAVIFVSDEDDHSRGEVSFYSRFLSEFKGVGNEKNIIVAAIVGDPATDQKPEGGCEADDGVASEGKRFHELVGLVGGTTASICSKDFASTLEQLGLTLAGLSRKFVLSKSPDPESLEVFVGFDGYVKGSDPQSPPPTCAKAEDCGDVANVRCDLTDLQNPLCRCINVDGCEQDQRCSAGGVCMSKVEENADTGWRLDLGEHAIFFDGSYVPPPDANIEVSYSKVENVFTLSRRGDQSTLKVMVDEDGDQGPNDPVEKLYGNHWMYDSLRNTVVFGGTEDYVPPLGSVIEISYSELNRSFPLSNPVEYIETLKVEEDPGDGNGYREILQDDVNGWMYHAESNAILFNGKHVPPFGAKIRVSHSSMTYLFVLSRIPRVDTLAVTLDKDGLGPEPELEVPQNTNAVPGWIYYGPDTVQPCANCISFEKIEWPPFGSVVSVSYQM